MSDRAQDLRTRVLDLFDGRWLWRSDTTRVVYRRDPGAGWLMFLDGQWRPCYHDDGTRAYYSLYAQYDETFIRVGKVL